jgi:hypothetical protein
MDLDQRNVPRPEDSRPVGNLWLVWMLLGIVPIPIGLIIGPINIFDSIQGSNKSLFECYAVVTAILSLICGIGQCGGLRNREMANKVVAIVAGVLVGFALTGINLFVVFFVGCASAFSHI